MVRDISSFMTWFLSQVYNIFIGCFGFLDNIHIASGVSLLDFTITIFILGLVVTILIAQPGNAMRVEKGVEARERKARAKSSKKGKG